MRVLAIETSCDETAVALLEISGPGEAPEIQILGNALFSQAHLHAEYGGVYPNLAKREHIKNLPILLQQVLESTKNQKLNPKQFLNSKFKIQNIEDTIDYICVTQGPGLEPALWVGINFAEELGKKWGVPVIPVDHMEGHIYSVLYKTESNPKSQTLNSKQTENSKDQNSKLEFPALALLVSGGHTELVLIKDFGQYEILGKTRDDAVGEAFDKVARMLDLGYPGGPAISAMADMARKRSEVDRDSPSMTEGRQPHAVSEITFPRPMIHSKNLDFSYSGLKTAVLYHTKNHPPQTDEDKQDIARAFEEAAVDVLISKTSTALEQNLNIKTLILGGGVAANKFLQTRIKELIETYPQVTLLMPEPSLSTDNAVMIGIAGFIRIESEERTGGEEIRARGNLSLDTTS